jgi:hypothetical protein
MNQAAINAAQTLGRTRSTEACCFSIAGAVVTGISTVGAGAGATPTTDSTALSAHKGAGSAAAGRVTAGNIGRLIVIKGITRSLSGTSIQSQNRTAAESLGKDNVTR